MKINFTKKEYRSLVDLLELADWVLHAHKVENPEETESYRDLIQKIYSFSKEMGIEHLINYSSELGGYYPTKEYEDTSDCMAYIEEYDDDTFWEELINRLATRDLINQKGVEKVKDMSLEEKITVSVELENWYANEFAENGLNNLILKADSDHVEGTRH